MAKLGERIASEVLDRRATLPRKPRPVALGGALAAGLPLVVVPLFADQPLNAGRVAAVGAGVVVEPLREGPSKGLPSSIDAVALRDAILAGLGNDALARGAQAIAAEMRALPAVDGWVAT